MSENRAVVIGARHGPLGYREPPGLTPKEFGIAKGIVETSVKKAIPALDTGKEIMIISSPAGRTMLTAEIWKKYLVDAGFSTREIIIDERLREVENFSWSFFKPLIVGGQVDGMGFEINKAVTNPKNLQYPKYFISGAVKNIPMYEKVKWPPEYRARVESFESFTKVKARMAEFLQDMTSYMEYSKGIKQVIIVSHDALFIRILDVSTLGVKLSLEPAGFVQMAVKDGKMTAERICDSSCEIISGNRNADVVKALLK